MNTYSTRNHLEPVMRRPRATLEEKLALMESRRKKLMFEPTIPLDAIRKKKPSITVTFSVGGFGVHNESTLTFFEDGSVKREVIWREDYDLSVAIPSSGWYEKEDAIRVHERFVALSSHRWPEVFEEKGYYTTDGTQWSLVVKRHGKLIHQHSGSNAYPSSWKAVTELFGIS
ncbi:hypothetical protein EVJ25_03865 [Exiguobacterium sp. SH1S4]|uniref:hypothetical protein n=2 Tax=unclassified Exiguobacterium TaxID=2644629 RepID=UPI001039F89A|nr:MULTISPECIES: hypothetical protein [unclassified Exiguobacterium]TCI55071.1 hypothetical protein EVJ25_03865 [Exiguobacterium sp. SH1S4]TCI63086.1 hypothetical protein EVJ21_06110 [Exiguobacterium sp. SH0S2]